MSTARREESEYELFQEDLERLEPHIETAIARVPAFGEVGIKKVYNGAIAYTPDGSPIVGPAWDLKNFWLNEGHSFGVTAAGGAGWQLAEWIVEGEPSIDMLGVDPRRFGPYASRGYLKVKNEEAYANVFTLHYPDEERVAARPLKTHALLRPHEALGAVFGSVYGWERPNWFAPPGYSARPRRARQPDVLLNHNHAPADHTGERPREMVASAAPTISSIVGDECRNVMENVGLQDMSAFAKCYRHRARAPRPGSTALIANRIPKKVGRIGLCHLLTQERRRALRVHRLSHARRRASTSSPPARSSGTTTTICRRPLPADGSVRMFPVTTRVGRAGARRPALARGAAEAHRHRSLERGLPLAHRRKRINVGPAEAHALRVNFVGELGWELHHPIEMQNTIFDLLMEAGREFGIKPFGIRAMMSMAVEKSYRLIGRELSIEYSAYESGLDRFVHPNKGEFLGRDALVARAAAASSGASSRWKCTASTDADARGSEPIWIGESSSAAPPPAATAGASGKSLALGMVQPELAEIGTELEIQILGERRRATIVAESPYDPENARLRA